MIKCFYQEKEGVNMKTRKLAVSVLAVLLAMLILPLSSFAERTSQTIPKKQTAEKSSQTPTESNNTQNPTKKRHLIEYTELTMKRFMEFEKKYGKDYDMRVSTQFVPYREYLEEYEVDSTFGTVSFDKEDFSVTRVIMTMSVVSAEPLQNEEFMFECVAVMSALEYDETDNSVFELNRKISKNGPSSAFDKTVEIWVDEVMKNVDEIENSDVNIGDEMLVYSGNYDYYVSSMNTDRGIIYYFTAKAREK